MVFNSLEFRRNIDFTVFTNTPVERNNTDVISGGVEFVGVGIVDEDTEHTFELVPHILTTEFGVESTDDFTIAVTLERILVFVFLLDFVVVVDFTVGGKGNRLLVFLL